MMQQSSSTVTKFLGDDALSVGFFDLVRLEGIDHAEFFAHAAYPFVGLDAHNVFLVSCGFRRRLRGGRLKMRDGIIWFWAVSLL